MRTILRSGIGFFIWYLLCYLWLLKLQTRKFCYCLLNEVDKSTTAFNYCDVLFMTDGMIDHPTDAYTSYVVPHWVRFLVSLGLG